MKPHTFDHNDRALIEAALQDTNPNNPIVKAISVRLDALRDILQQATNERKSLPAEITVTKPATVLDEIVLALFKETLASIPGAPRVRILDQGRQ